jgi:hypothetical protein
MEKKTEIGTANIPDGLKRRSIICLYRDGIWRTGDNLIEGWVVMVDTGRKLAVCVQDFHGQYRFMDGYWWHQCDEDVLGDWLIVNRLFSVYFGNEDPMLNDNDVIGRILLSNYAYIDNNRNIKSI